MVNLHTLVLGRLQTNCYVVWGEGSSSCVVVDPAAEPEKILDFLKAQGLSLEAIFLTHGHFDHVGAVEALRSATGCGLWMHQGDYHQRPHPTIDFLYPLHDKDLGEVRCCQDGDEISAAGLTFSVIHTPGHTQGSVCYQVEDILLSGDTLFAGGCGRTDLPGSSPEAIYISLADLAELDDKLRVFPGHGESTTLAREKKYNPYMR